MRVSIVINNVEVTGTFKYAALLARGFQDLGWDVQVVHSRERANSQLIRPLLGSVPTRRISGGQLTAWISRLPAYVQIHVFGSQTMALDETPDFLGAFTTRREFLGVVADSDLVIFAAPLSYRPWLLLRPPLPRSILVFHEPMAGAYFPGPVRRAVRAYWQRAARRVSSVVTMTARAAEVLETTGIHARVEHHGFEQRAVGPKDENLVLADTKWRGGAQWGRDPLFVVELARRIPSARFVIFGSIASASLRQELISAIDREGLSERVQVVEHVDESGLNELYRRAKVVARWGSREVGFTMSLTTAVSWGCIPVLSKNLGGASHLAEEVSEELTVSGNEEFVSVISRLLQDPEYYHRLRTRVDAWRLRRPWTAVCSRMWESVAPSHPPVHAGVPVAGAPTIEPAR